MFVWWVNRNDPADLKRFGITDLPQHYQYGNNFLIGNTLTTYYAGSGDKRVLRALQLAYGGTRDWARFAAVQHFLPAYETYTWTGNGEIRESFGELFCPPSKKPGPSSGISQHGVLWHAVDGPGFWNIGYLWNGDAKFDQRNSVHLEKFEQEYVQPFGVNVGDEEMGWVSAFRGTETCDVFYCWNCRFNFQKTHDPMCCGAATTLMVPLYPMYMCLATYDNGLAWTLL